MIGGDSWCWRLRQLGWWLGWGMAGAGVEIAGDGAVGDR